MTRAAYYLAVLSLILFVWAYLKFQVLAAHPDRTGVRATVDAFPYILLVWLGCYCLFKLGYDVLSYKNMPEAIDELKIEMDHARVDLKRKGFKSK
jgi:dolichol-phosphate mannosyltransferase subunit 3